MAHLGFAKTLSLVTLLVFLVSASAAADPWPSTRWPDTAGDTVSGSDIDPANILFAEDTGDGINNITAFTGDPITVTSTAGINFSPGGEAADLFFVDLGDAGIFEVNFNTVSAFFNFTLSTLFDVYQIVPTSTVGVEFEAPSATTSGPAYSFDRDNAPSARFPHSTFEIADTEVSRVNSGGNYVNVPDTQTIATTGDANPATLVDFVPRERSVQITCNDPDSCDITLDEAPAEPVDDGQITTFICMTTNTCDFSDTANVTELAGAASLGQYDTLTVIYAVDRYIELSRSNN